MRVDEWVRKQASGAWKRVAIRESTKGRIIVDILHKIVWLWDGKEAEARKWHLVVRREIASPEEIKYSLSNAALDTSTERLAFMQAQRYWVERPFQDAKNQCGMGEYQARGWFAWHHHMTMVLLAMLFMLEQRLQHHEDIPLLSCPDVTTLLKSVLPKRDINAEEVLRQQTTKAPHFVEIAHSVPPLKYSHLQKELLTFGREVAAALGIKDGITHCEVMLTEAGFKVIECANRIPGDQILTLHRNSYGVNIANAVIRHAVNESVLLNPILSKSTVLKHLMDHIRLNWTVPLGSRLGMVETPRLIDEGCLVRFKFLTPAMLP